MKEEQEEKEEEKEEEEEEGARPSCLALGQGPHPAQLLGADAARGFWRWWLQSRRSRCRRWWLR